jgi:predicted RNA-binding protein YlqC (UPF0109 family)
MKELLEFLIKNILPDENEVEIIHNQENNEEEFIVKLPQDKIGTVIGSGGKTIRAIKTLMSLKSKGKNFSLEIKEV